MPVRELEKLSLPLDGLEALRLLHLEGATQAEAGSRLGVSASTVSRMAQQAHRIITEALVLGKALCIEGGPVTVVRIGSDLHELAENQQVSETASTRQGESMIVAVPYLDGNVNAHFGSTCGHHHGEHH